MTKRKRCKSCGAFVCNTTGNDDLRMRMLAERIASASELFIDAVVGAQKRLVESLKDARRDIYDLKDRRK